MPSSKTVIVAQPGGRELMPAYNPIEILVSDPAAVILYCDVYFNGTYYKTLTCTSPVQNIFRFDIQDAAQEVLESKPPVFINSTGIANDVRVITDCYCRIREAVMSAGLIVPEVPIPIQATMTTPAVQGGGVMTTTFQILNSRLQHEDNQSLTTHMLSYAAFSNNTWKFLPISHRVGGYRIGRADYDRYAFYPFAGLLGTVYKIRVTDLVTGTQYLLNSAANGTFSIAFFKVWYLPTSPRLLDTLVPVTTAVPWSSISRYRVALAADIFGVYTDIFITPDIYLDESCEKQVRIHFVNWLGCFDSIAFKEKDDIMKTTSARWEKRITTKPTSNQKSLRGSNRFDVRSDNYYQCVGYFQESQMELMKELLSSPIAYIEWTGKQGQADDYLPIVIHDGEITANKSDEEYEYMAEISFSLPDKVHLRN